MHLAVSTDGSRITATSHTPATCPTCHTPVRAKCGSIKVWHWSHISLRDCDTWAEPDSAWHHEWQSHFPPENVEIVRREFGICHRADVLTDHGTVIEFQRSSLPPAEIRAREDFWGDMIWVFDAQDAHAKNRLDLRPPNETKSYWTFRWKHARTSLGACTRPVFLDLSDEYMFRIRRIHLDGRVGGWGEMLSRSNFLGEQGGWFYED